MNKVHGQAQMRWELVRLTERPELLPTMAEWFHEKWKIPLEAYQESMHECLMQQAAVPQWYVALQNNKIIGGLGVIANDFHPRTDLTPNVCAVYVEPDCRGNGLAGCLLQSACEDMKQRGIDTLFLLTSHTGFYERYGWEFLCMAQNDGGTELSRVYRHTAR